MLVWSGWRRRGLQPRNEMRAGGFRETEVLTLAEAAPLAA